MKDTRHDDESRRGRPDLDGALGGSGEADVVRLRVVLLRHIRRAGRGDRHHTRRVIQEVVDARRAVRAAKLLYLLDGGRGVGPCSHDYCWHPRQIPSNDRADYRRGRGGRRGRRRATRVRSCRAADHAAQPRRGTWPWSPAAAASAPGPAQSPWPHAAGRRIPARGQGGSPRLPAGRHRSSPHWPSDLSGPWEAAAPPRPSCPLRTGRCTPRRSSPKGRRSPGWGRRAPACGRVPSGSRSSPPSRGEQSHTALGTRSRPRRPGSSRCAGARLGCRGSGRRAWAARGRARTAGSPAPTGPCTRQPGPRRSGTSGHPSQGFRLRRHAQIRHVLCKAKSSWRCSYSLPGGS